MSSSSFGPSTSSNIPPPLPDRAKSVSGIVSGVESSSGLRNRVPNVGSSSSLSSSSMDTLGEHYAHLGKHVKEVRRRNTKNTSLIAPKISDYQEKKYDKVIATKWTEYIEAWIKYLVGSAAYDEIDRPLEPFSLNTVKHDIDRLYPMIVPLIEPAKKIRPIYRWENKSLTGGIAFAYLILWYYDLILPFLCLSAAMGIAWIRLDMFAQYGVDALNEQPETEETVKKWNKGFWMKMRRTMGTPSPYGFNLYDDLDINLGEMRKDLYENYGPTIQLILSDTVDYLERIKNLVTWKRPMKARILLVLVASSSFSLTFLPTQYMGKVIFFYIGVEFFILQPLRSYYPRHRRLFNVMNLLLWGVPNDAEYAMEVVRLNKPAAARKTKSTSNLHQESSTSEASTSNTNPPRAATLVHRTSATSVSEISTNIIKNMNPIDDNTKLGDRPAASTAATLAMLAAAAAVNKVKKMNKNKKEKQKQKLLREQQEAAGSSDSIMSTDTTETADDTVSINSTASSNDDDPDAFGCMYKGTIPGRITIRDHGLVFQTSRMTGSMTLVECAYADIVGVKKTKQFDMLVWHANGIDISLSDGVVLHFENVIKRDDCFNRLVSVSSDEGGGAWRKM